MEHHHTDHQMQMGPSDAGSSGEELQAMTMMKMYFHFGLGDLFLIRHFVLDSPLRLTVVCFFVFLGAVLLEAIDYTRGVLNCRCMEEAAARAKADLVGQQQQQQRTDSNTLSREELLDRNGGQEELSPDNGQAVMQISSSASAEQLATGNRDSECCRQSKEKKSFLPPLFGPVNSVVPMKIRLLQSVLQFTRTGLSLVLMLVAMTYNVCLILPIMLGSAIGFYVFYRTGSDVTSVCH